MQLLPKEHSFNEPLGLLSDCHRRVEKFLNVLLKVGQEAPEDQLTPLYIQGLETALDYFRDAAPKHTEDEEHSLFPRITHDSRAREIIDRLESDHDAVEPLHAKVEEFGRDWLRAGVISPKNRQAFTRTVEELIAHYRNHIREEDEVLFPLAAKLLDPEEVKAIGREMETRRHS